MSAPQPGTNRPHYVGGVGTDCCRCRACLCGLAAAYDIELSGFAGDFAGFNGVYHVSYFTTNNMWQADLTFRQLVLPGDPEPLHDEAYEWANLPHDTSGCGGSHLYGSSQLIFIWFGCAASGNWIVIDLRSTDNNAPNGPVGVWQQWRTSFAKTIPCRALGWTPLDWNAGAWSDDSPQADPPLGPGKPPGSNPQCKVRVHVP